ncbi:MAG: zinc ribbon domain-containing protein [Candidatus Hydrogenedens sp.]|nr:zinc ribbon domain-containing protein [Candidatus Hydrogenedentota bacterium]NLF58284.1 zinc ribbon domain-containing protein [Candidatus Hydrogenedens sp.]
MPLFAFFCKACGAQSEILIRGEETPVCPVCGSPRLEKQMSHFAALSGTSTDPACGACCARNESCCMQQGGCGF